MKICLLLQLFIYVVANAQSSEITSTEHFGIGQTLVAVEKKCFNHCNENVLFLNLHDDENTSVIAAEYSLCEKGGSMVHIQNCAQRLIAFTFKNQQFLFDPNRIYSREGIISNMQLLSPRYDSIAANEIAAFAARLLTKYFGQCRLIVALHNNRDKELSVLSYQQDQQFKKHYGKVFINPVMDADDFILTTDSIIYLKLVEKNINVIWENADSTKDDGSLSVYAGRHHIAYINVEAQHQHLDEQVSMLNALEAIIEEYNHKDE